MKKREAVPKKRLPTTESSPARPPERPELFALPALEPLTFPSFPTVQQLLQHQSGEAAHPLLVPTQVLPPKETTLFQGLLGGRPEVLQDHALDHPEAYDDEALAVLTALSGGTKKVEGLTPDDRKALDRATLSFSSYRPPKSPSEVKKQPVQRPALLSRVEYEPTDGDIPGEMPAFWWLR